MFSVFDGFILGFVQGIAEWLPISSEAMVNLIAINILKIDPASALNLALVLHIGTALSALVYFRQTIFELLLNPRKNKALLQFYSVITAVSLLVGGLLYLALKQITVMVSGGAWLTVLMGVALLVTAWLLRTGERGLRKDNDITLADAFLFGGVQGLAVVPGISRSGSTVAALLWRHYRSSDALALSFIMGIPMIFAGALLLLLTEPAVLSASTSIAGLTALGTSFIVGLGSIAALLKLARKINFAKFVLLIGVLAIAAGLIDILLV